MLTTHNLIACVCMWVGESIISIVYFYLWVFCSLIGTIVENDTEVDDYYDGKTLYYVNRHHSIIVMKYTDLIIKKFSCED